MSKREYLAVKNFFHNTKGIDRQLLKGLVREVLNDMVKDEMRRYFESNAFHGLIAHTLDKSTFPSIEGGLKSIAISTVQEMVRQKFGEYEIKFVVKE